MTRLLFMFLALLTGCASLGPSPNGGAHNDQNWLVRGKLSVTTPEDTVTGYLSWEQQQQAYDLFISGPLGQGASRLTGNDRFAELTLPGWERPQRAPSAEHLLQHYMGWTFPVQNVRYWVQGQPSPGEQTKVQRDEQGRLISLQQHGWLIRYSRYSRQGQRWLPGLIKVSGHNHRFVFAIKEWTLRG
ncbi:outer-membrane lipoprotein LolB [Bacterioplanes sanyensis]|uniref:lipoprotein insertase outer membrane protein LolB n=1 Tax=Bacterioplanes sanyensis TaxID=1249553 RepID=UPI001677C55A|nr:lipoprotein insertase outer membrane protein LolB [Bacterioplanes sanyensis]GGY38044.1 outer-membrane lipoprotein LolB [Bacterioplanes sanyensis]